MKVVHKDLVEGAGGVAWRLGIESDTWNADDRGSALCRVTIFRPDLPNDIPWLVTLACFTPAEARKELDRLANLLRGDDDAPDA
jgi:hypothetical protein